MRPRGRTLGLTLVFYMVLHHNRASGSYRDPPLCDQDCIKGLSAAKALRNEKHASSSPLGDALHQLGGIEERQRLSQYSDLFEHVPREVQQKVNMMNVIGQFEDGLKNPCWLQERANGEEPMLQCIPYFYILGPQKTGTTDLYDRLCRHPSIIAGRTKEPQYWTQRMPRLMDSAISNPGERDYTTNFWPLSTKIVKGMSNLSKEGSNSLPLEADQVTVDGSATTLYLKRGFVMEKNLTLAPFIHAIQPNAKLVMILRDPIERMYSDYRYFFGTGNPLRGFDKAMKRPRCVGPAGTLHGESKEIEAISGPGPSPEHFHEVVKRKIERIHACISKNGLATCSRDPTFGEAGIVVCPPGRLMMGIYSVYIEEWLQSFPREQLYVFRLEDLDVKHNSSFATTNSAIEESKAAKRRELSKLFDFLGVEQPTVGSWEQIASHKVSNKIKSIGSMLPKTRLLLRDFYKPFNEKLSALLGDDKFLWDDVH